MTIVTITEAAELAGVSRGTLYNRLDKGVLSRAEGGIDLAELLRVFGPLLPLKAAREPDDVLGGPDAVEHASASPDGLLVRTLEQRLVRADEDARWLRELLAERERVITEKELRLAEAQTRLAERETFWTHQVQALLPTPANAAPRSFWQRLLGA